MSNTNTLLTLIFVAIVGIGGYLVYEANQDSPAEQMAESFDEFTEDVAN